MCIRGPCISQKGWSALTFGAVVLARSVRRRRRSRSRSRSRRRRSRRRRRRRRRRKVYSKLTQ